MTIEELFEKSGKEYLAFDIGKGTEMLNVEQLKKRLGESIPIEPPVKVQIADTPEEYEKSIGMDILKEKHRAKTKYWMALSPHWTDRQLSDKQKTEYRIVYWANYGDNETYGWFTVEQIRQWLETPKLKLYELGGIRERESNFSLERLCASPDCEMSSLLRKKLDKYSR